MLKAIPTAAVFPNLIGVSTADTPENSKLKQQRDKLDIYFEGLNIDDTPDVQSMENADLAVFSTSNFPSHDRIVGAINNGTAMAIAGNYARRTLLGQLQNVPRGWVSPSDSRSSILANDINYTFGYELPSTTMNGIALAYPAQDGVLEFHTREGRYPTDQDTLKAIIREYQGISHQEDEVTVMSGYDDEWERNGTSSSTTENCPGGTLKVVITCYTLPDEDGIVSWKYSDRMTAGQSPEACGDGVGTYGYNSEAFRRMTYGGSHEGDLLSFDPTTTTSSSTATVNISTSGVGASWSYQIPDVTVEAHENHSEDAIRWEHEILEESSLTDSTFVSEPGVIVGYPAETEVANYHTETEYKYTWSNSTWTIYSDSEGGWLIS